MRRRVADYGIWQNAKRKALGPDGLGVQIQGLRPVSSFGFGEFTQSHSSLVFIL